MMLNYAESCGTPPTAFFSSWEMLSFEKLKTSPKKDSTKQKGQLASKKRPCMYVGVCVCGFADVCSRWMAWYCSFSVSSHNEQTIGHLADWPHEHRLNRIQELRNLMHVLVIWTFHKFWTISQMIFLPFIYSFEFVYFQMNFPHLNIHFIWQCHNWCLTDNDFPKPEYCGTFLITW